MKKHMMSMILHCGSDAISQVSDSNVYSNNRSSNKRQRLDNTASSARFKGVLLQPNGHWGAQIYKNHNRVWLGTFKSEKEAAMAYDSAAIKLRNGDAHRNYPWTNLTIQEPKFQDLYTTDAVLDMIKDGSYQSKFVDFLKGQSLPLIDKESGMDHNLLRESGSNGGYSCQQLFQKELTPSDVGKLNRLVIPKKYAVKYFPQVFELGSKEDTTTDGCGGDEVPLEFYDKQRRLWKFRYCYWKSSQSFVFTRGWNRFVKENELKAKDVITFYRYEYRGWPVRKERFDMIDISYNGDESNIGHFGGFDGYVGNRLDLQLGCGRSSTSIECEPSSRDGQAKEEDNVMVGLVLPPPPVVMENKGVRLFGVNIS